MDQSDFKNVLLKFENDVIIRGVQGGKIGREEMVPVRNGKLSKQRFGKLVGLEIDCSVSLAVDYYGHLKKSAGFFRDVQDATPKGTQARMMKSTVVHFASIKVEDVVELAPDLVPVFPILKRELLKLRGFKDE
jgi:hypothetical protein